MEKRSFRYLVIAMILVLALISGSGILAKEPAKSSKEEGKISEVEYEVNINQIAFIVKFDKNQDGKVDNKEFTGMHFSNLDKNGDGYIEPHEAPAGETAY
jgi:hypothetical protein